MESKISNSVTSTLVGALKVCSVLSFLVFAIIGVVMAEESHTYYKSFNQVAFIMWTMLGVFSAASFWALSVVVAACQKYLNSDK